jgi:hypothetical protein
MPHVAAAGGKFLSSAVIAVLALLASCFATGCGKFKLLLLLRAQNMTTLFAPCLPCHAVLQLVELLRLEANCIKWWPDQGTKKYFNDTAGMHSTAYSW